ncbi:hypothetical protein [Streptomyces sp. XY332]|uniref:hypothetical protein n=1 Tax=Streptomyces sp. XY332 TaxID=1415561 RepID=UPI0006B18E27|nr:hypothetical protein [Streptomyces sp. XY332]
MIRAAFEHYLGLVEKDPEPVPHDETRAREVAGRYESDVMNIDIATDRQRLTLAVEIKPEIRAADGTVTGVDLGGRLFTRTTQAETVS